MFHSFASRLMVSFLGILALLLLLLTMNFSSIFNSFVEDERNNRTHELKQTLSVLLAPGLFASDIASIDHFVKELKNNSAEIAYLSVKDVNQNELVTIGQAYSGLEKNTLLINLYGENVGSVSFAISGDKYQSLIQSVQQQMILVFVAGFLVSIALIFWISKLLTRDLTSLSEAATEATKGNYQHETHIRRVDEIGKLSTHFDEMRLAILDRTNELESERGRLSVLLDNMALGIVFESASGQLEYLNQAFIEMWELDPRVSRFRNIEDVVSTSRFTFTDGFAWRKNLHKDRVEEATLSDGRCLMISYVEISSSNEHKGHLWILEDVTREKQMRESLYRAASHDALTGLYNRHQFQIEIERLSNLVSRNKQHLVLMLFDLDEFKTINDTYGHLQGDQVLVKVASKLSEMTRKTDVLCRLGGDEFALLSLTDHLDHIEPLAEKIVSVVSSAYHLFEGETFRLTTSVGISYYPDTAINTVDLVTQADVAMYEAKFHGKNTYKVFDESMMKVGRSLEKITWSERIEKALEKDLFKLCYQGIYNTQSKEITHYEALIRMMDETETHMIPPARFIPMAEKTGHILKIDRMVIFEVVSLLAKRPELPPISVNISGKSFDDRSLPSFIGNTLREFSVAPEKLLIELTETEAVSDIQDASGFINDLNRLGCVVCLDDFGTGFSSFAYLKHLDVGVLKIDGSFIVDLHKSEENQVIVKSMVDVAKSLGKKTIAEFVENQAILDVLEVLGVDMVQGYHLHKPEVEKDVFK